MGNGLFGFGISPPGLRSVTTGIPCDYARAVLASGGILNVPVPIYVVSAHAPPLAPILTPPRLSVDRRIFLRQSICQAVNDEIVPSLHSFPIQFRPLDHSRVFESLAELTNYGREKENALHLECFPLWRNAFDWAVVVMVNNPRDPSIWTGTNIRFMAYHYKLFDAVAIGSVSRWYEKYLDLKKLTQPHLSPSAFSPRSHVAVRLGVLRFSGNRILAKIPADGIGISNLSKSRLDELHAELHTFLRQIDDFLGSQIGVTRRDVCRQYAGPIVEFYRYEFKRQSDSMSEKFRQELILFVRHCQRMLDKQTRQQIVPSFLLRYTPILHRAPSAPCPVLRISQDQRAQSPQYLVDRIFEHSQRLSKHAFGDIARFKVGFLGFYTTGVGPIKQTLAWFFADIVEYKLPDGEPLLTFIDDRKEMIRPSVRATDLISMQLFHVLGRMMGLAIYYDMHIGIPFSPGFWYVLKHDPLTPKSEEHESLLRRVGRTAISFLQREDPKKYKTLTGADPFCPLEVLHGMAFSLDDERYASPETMREYLLDQAVHDTMSSITPQARAVASGMYDVLAFPQLSYLTVDELEEYGRVLVEIDVESLRRSTQYELTAVGGGEPGSNENIQWFWEILTSFDQDQLGKFLAFVSGSKFPPLRGFGPGTWMKITVNPALVKDPRGETVDQPFRSATCFKLLKMGTFSSKEIMQEILENSISVEFMDNA
jgi:hypothetical protein